MNTIRSYVAVLRRRGEEGATAVEYGIMVALIAAIIVAIVLVLGQQVQRGFCTTSTGLEAGGIYNDTGAAGGPAASDCA